ncbi:LysR family transcriptional regulator [Nonomuraea antimicrobica]
MHHVPKLLDGRLKLRHLVLVDVLSTQGTVIGAARALHVTQPVVTRSLQDLEQVLGVALYDRGPRGLTPPTSASPSPPTRAPSSPSSPRRPATSPRSPTRNVEPWSWGPTSPGRTC